jgi:UDP-4-amino-4,6-dideoxy-N-acetyl-beta-L-altrosamine transaminase
VIPYGKQDINQADIDAVINVLKSDFLTQGNQVPAFEQLVSNYCGADYGVAVNSATSALHIACLSLGLGVGDWLWTSPNSFVASANCGLYCGANVDFVDIDPQTYNMSAVELEKKLIRANKENKLPKIVIPVHFAGQSCDMQKIHFLSKEYGFRIIEDASHAIGGKYLGGPIGCCLYSDITVFSFHPVKIITTAEGGLATTNSKELAEKMQLFRSHGIERDKNLIKTKSDDGWYYEQINLGFNYRMTELQAALGISQMKRLDEFINKRHILQKRYDDLFQYFPLTRPFQLPECYSALHLYPILIEIENNNNGRQQVFNELRKNGIGINVHYIPIHTHPYYRQLGFKEGDFPNCEAYYSRTISLPLYSGLALKEQDQIISTIDEILANI